MSLDDFFLESPDEAWKKMKQMFEADFSPTKPYMTTSTRIKYRTRDHDIVTYDVGYATAKYSLSFGSGDILFASSTNDSYTADGKILIRARRRFNARRTSFSEHFDFATSSEKYLSISFSINSGEINSRSSDENKVLVIPCEAINAEKSTLTSTTINIKNQLCRALTWRSWIPLRTFLPSSSANFSASSSVSLDLEAIDFKTRNCATRCWMASRAIMDQSIIFNSSISSFKSWGIDKVSVAIPFTVEGNLYKSFAIDFNDDRVFGIHTEAP